MRKRVLLWIVSTEILILLSMLSLNISATNKAFAADTTSPSINRESPFAQYYDSINRQVTQKSSSIDTARALSLAQASTEFQSIARTVDASFNSVFSTWSSKVVGDDVSVSLSSVNVVYSYTAGDGSSTNIVITEDPLLNAVTTVSLQEGLRSGALLREVSACRAAHTAG